MKKNKKQYNLQIPLKKNTYSSRYYWSGYSNLQNF